MWLGEVDVELPDGERFWHHVVAFTCGEDAEVVAEVADPAVAARDVVAVPLMAPPTLSLSAVSASIRPGGRSANTTGAPGPHLWHRKP